MVKTNNLETLSSEQVQTSVVNAIMEQITAELRAGAQAAEQKIHTKRHPAGNSVKATRFAARAAMAAGGRGYMEGSTIAPEKMREAIHKAFQQAFGPDKEFVVLLTRDTNHARIVRAVAKTLPEAVERRQHEMLQSQIDALVDIYLPTDPLAPALAEIVRDNAEARADFLGKVHMLSAEQVADLAGHAAKNRSVTASRWKKTGLIFSVRHKGNDLYPIFQFKDQIPHPTVAKVLAALPGKMSGWQIAFWFAGGNGWLDGARPMDRLDNPDAVLAAAEHEDEAWMG